MQVFFDSLDLFLTDVPVDKKLHPFLTVHTHLTYSLHPFISLHYRDIQILKGCMRESETDRYWATAKMPMNRVHHLRSK